MSKRIPKTREEKMMITLIRMKENTEKAEELSNELESIINKLSELDKKRYYKITQEMRKLDNEYRSCQSRLSFMNLDEGLLNIQFDGIEGDPPPKMLNNIETGEEPPS